MAGQRIPGPIGASDSAVIDSGTLCRALTPAPGPVGATLATTAGGNDAHAEGGIQIVMTPIQLAAVLEGDSVDPQATASNRIWGAVGLVGAALELVGAGALLIAPEPTTVTKFAGAALGAHGVDTAVASARQLATGQRTQTLTASTAQAAAELAGADPRTAELIGVGADIAPSLVAGAVGALRVLAVRRGAISLLAEEAAGGHTIARHVGKTAAELQARLAAQPGISAASTFRTLADAERVVAQALQVHRTTVQAWARTAAVGRTLRLEVDAGRVIGLSLPRGQAVAGAATRAAVILRRVQQGNRVHFVLTAFPIL